ncbi:MAG: 30S ribosomal protein S16 [Candidatus Hydrogenedentes bacterium]|nr:30S ribosomal protein S16 [Candidatus Hydrogenedentota bacterium]
MATTIRLKRGGRTHNPYYRIVVTDPRRKTGGLEVDILGFYHPCARPEPVSEVNVIKALDWLRKGAQPSDTAKSLFRSLGVMKHFHEGTTPEETTATFKGGVVENKGYMAPPPPKEEAPAPVEAEAAEAVEAPVEEAAADAETAE